MILVRKIKGVYRDTSAGEIIHVILLFVPIARRDAIATSALQSGNKNFQSSFNTPSF